MLSGCALRAQGYDSHLVKDGEMVVIFDSAQVLPCYVVHFE